MTHVWHKRSVLLSQYFKFTICCQCYKVVAPAERSKVMASYRHIQNHLLDDFHMPSSQAEIQALHQKPVILHSQPLQTHCQVTVT